MDAMRMTEPRQYIIKSLFLQDAVEISLLCALLALVVYFVTQRKIRHVLVISCWIPVLLLFFNSDLFGFSRVRILPQGIELNYGLLSTRNIMLPAISKWKIVTGVYGINKTRRFHCLMIADRVSMRVSGYQGLALLREIGAEIDSLPVSFIQR